MSFLFDFLAASSIIGIWPRFIEPKRLKVTEIKWSVPKSRLCGLKIAHLTDLHLNKKTSQKFLDKIVRRLKAYSPDLILFTGDFLCYSLLDSPKRLSAFLDQLQAPLGSFCTFGNHDYASYLTLNEQGFYDLSSPPHLIKAIQKGLSALFLPPKKIRGSSNRAINVLQHDALGALLKSSNFQLLENKTVTLPVGLNVTGLGDLSAGRCDPKKAFLGFDRRFPGITLSHNPDSLPLLIDTPGEFILSGHTHGEQIHIPWPKWGRRLSQKLARLENGAYTRGLFHVGNKKLYVNRGLGCHKPFRLFSPPEICIIEVTGT